MLKYVGTGSEVTREIWEMRLLTLWPRLELGGCGTLSKNANHVIWKPRFASVRVICCFGSWLQSLFSALLQLGLRSQCFCGQWFASVSIFLSSWYAVSVSASPRNVVYYVLWVTATKFLFVSLESMYLPVGELFPVVFLVPVPVLAGLSCSLRRPWGILGCVRRGCCSLVILQCFEILSQVLRIKLHLAFALGGWTSICGNISRSSCPEMVCCACAWWHASTQHVSGSVRAGQWFCRRWYTWYDGRPWINRKTCRGTFGVWVLEECGYLSQ